MHKDINKKFTLYFNGACLPGAVEADVRRGFTNLFGISTEEAAPLFTGEMLFLKTDLNDFSLGRYRAALDRIGAQYQYWEQPVSDSVVSEDHLEACPKCGHIRENEIECAACGIIFEKYRQIRKRTEAQPIPPPGSEEQNDYQDTVYDPDARRAKGGIQIGSALLVGIFLVDEILQTKGMDIGYWPYIIANISFVYGGWFFAKRRGYGNIIRFLGLLNLVGITVLYLLPDRTGGKRPKVSILKPSIAAGLVIVIGLYWGYQTYQKQRIEKTLFAMAAAVKPRNGTYPSDNLLDGVEVFQKAHASLYRFSEETLTALSDYDFRPTDVGRISNQLFASLADYFVWMNYQRYLHAQEYEEIPYYLTSKAISREKMEFLDLIRSYTSAEAELGDNPRFINAFQTWCTNCQVWDKLIGACIQQPGHRSSRISVYIWDVYSHLREQQLMMTTGLESSPADSGLSLPKYPKNIFSSAKINPNGIIELRLNHHSATELSEKLIVLAYYQDPENPQNFSFNSKFAFIGGDLSPKFLSIGNFSIFYDWIKASPGD